MAVTDHDSFLSGIEDLASSPVVAVYHAVRNIPYGSVGERDPFLVVARNSGSCSGKHLLLRDLLRRTGCEAEIITMFTHFESRLGQHPSFPADLNALIAEGGICDFHHYVRARSRPGPWVKLDATWHDALAPYPFPVNTDWQGQGDTQLASVPLEEHPAVEDLVPYKTALVASLSPPDRDRRSRFFALLADWIASR